MSTGTSPARADSHPPRPADSGNSTVAEHRPRRPTLSTCVLIGFLAGVTAGLLAGEYCAPLGVIGDIFVGLLQMTVLPYVALSLLINVGRLDLATCRRLALAVAGVLLGLWILVALVIAILPAAFPTWQSGSFFSASMLESPPQINFLELFIPTNPFQALAENIVPAVVLFSIAVGLGLIGIPEKGTLLDGLQVLLKALGRVNHYVALAAPVGVFAIMAKTAGTIGLEQLAQLQVYLVVYTAATVFLAFAVLPLLVSSVTPISYRSFVRSAWGPLLTAFATGKVLVVLPLIAEEAAKLLQGSNKPPDEGARPEALVSLGYPFPHLGKLLALLFIPFTAWFVGNPLEWGEYPRLLAAGIVSMFGSPLASIPFLLDLERLPADMFQMFVASGVLCGRLGDVLGVVHLLAFTLLTTCLVDGRMQMRPSRLLPRAAGLLAVLLLLTAGLHAGLQPLVGRLPSKEKTLLGMHSAVVTEPHVQWKTDAPPPDPLPGPASESSQPGNGFRAATARLERIRRRGALRVGYLEENLPFSFENQSGQLVGFDVDMAHLLASELGCQLWLIPVTVEDLEQQLQQDAVDLVMSGIGITTERLESIVFSRPYLRVTFSLIVRDHHRRAFDTVASIRELPRLRIATPPSQYFSDALRELWPQVELVTVQTPREFFERPEGELDALLISAEAGSAWTIIYPGFTPVIPRSQRATLPLAYPVAARDLEFATFVSQWIDLKSGSTDFQQLYDYWILGKVPPAHGPRWCVLRDVLGWLP